MRPTLTLAAACLALLPAARPALADTGMSLGVYLWNRPDEEPVRAQFISIAGGDTEIEIDSPKGTKTDSHPATEQEQTLLSAALKDRMAALAMTQTLRPAGPYITVEWHFSTDTGYIDSSETYALDAVPAAVVALEKAVFGGTLAK
jgi:hypothetical protein